MAKHSESQDMRNVVGWLQGQPGVRSVTQGRYTRSRHKHAPAFCRVVEGDRTKVHVRAYDKLGTKDLFVYAEPNANRDRWVALLVGGKRPGVTPEPKSNGFYEKTVVVQKEKPFAVKALDKNERPAAEAKAANDHAGQIFNVTPELAASWLERNTRNRPLRNDIVQKYAADMKAGRWMISPDAIAFDKNGQVVNGQHRLWAAFESGMTVPMLVAFDLDPNVVNVLDDHLRRRLTDVIKLNHPGMDVNQKQTAVARAMQEASVMRVGGNTKAALAKLTRQEQISFLERHHEAIIFAIRECFSNSTKRGLSQANVVQAVARAYYTADRDRLVAFGRVMLSGNVVEPREDAAAILLRNWLLTQQAMAARSAAALIRSKSERALKAFLDREPIKKLFEAPDGQILFKLPEEEAPGRKR